ncbi:YqeB family protein [Streptomyces flavofungini]|uniref:YqeB family protein n=1 Tax=Streptomyces flavofungini TaxID=68200 RepID=UPI0034E010B8
MPSDRFEKRPGAAEPRTTDLRHSKGDLWVLLAGLPAAGLLIGLAVPRLARWASDSPVLPWRDAVAFVGGLDAPWQTGVVMAAGLVVGLVLAFVAMAEAMRLRLTDEEVRVEQHDSTLVLRRADIAAVFRDGKHLVVLGRDSAELARGEHQAPAAALAEAFRAHGYPWRDADPHAALFRRWIPGTPDLPAEAHALLKAREAALKRDAPRDARDLAEAVREAGFAVRDEKGEQYVRPLVGE